MCKTRGEQKQPPPANPPFPSNATPRTPRETPYVRSRPLPARPNERRGGAPRWENFRSESDEKPPPGSAVCGAAAGGSARLLRQRRPSFAASVSVNLPPSCRGENSIKILPSCSSQDQHPQGRPKPQRPLCAELLNHIFVSMRHRSPISRHLYIPYIPTSLYIPWQCSDGAYRRFA